MFWQPYSQIVEELEDRFGEDRIEEILGHVKESLTQSQSDTIDSHGINGTLSEQQGSLIVEQEQWDFDADAPYEEDMYDDTGEGAGVEGDLDMEEDWTEPTPPFASNPTTVCVLHLNTPSVKATLNNPCANIVIKGLYAIASANHAVCQTVPDAGLAIIDWSSIGQKSKKKYRAENDTNMILIVVRRMISWNPLHDPTRVFRSSQGRRPVKEPLQR